MASYDYLGIKAAGGAYVLEEGGYDIRLQSDSHNMIDHRTITVAKDVIYSDDKDGKRPSDGIYFRYFRRLSKWKNASPITQ